jgi:CRISPR-associated endonuclease/helicase Cas3
MRTLVEQTERAVAVWLEKAGLVPKQCLHVLMGGLSPSDWHLEPERESVLIGTQDMLLSRALNRGYGSGRARWPMEYALLNVDCLWVMDEIQLMDVGLATSAQLQGFANGDAEAEKLPRPRRTWWMSATLQQDWLRRAPDIGDVDRLPTTQLESSEKTGPLWAVTKTLSIERVPVSNDKNTESWAELVAGAHAKTDRGLTLAIANTVRSAIALHKALEKGKKTNLLAEDVDLRLLHSRFRGVERRKWADDFLSRQRCEKPGQNRIIVSTQVVEAGVDISANALVTELAPWASLVQRIGRCARYGGQGLIIVVDRRHTEASAAAIIAKDDEERATNRRDADRSTVMPYDLAEVEAAAEGIELLPAAAAPATLDEFERGQAELGEQGLLPRLYPYTPMHVLTRRELRDLFDTGPDLTGADIDISRFVREGDERDVTVWWWPIPEGEWPHIRLRPAHDALCRVPVDDARKWLASGAGRVVDGEPTASAPARGGKGSPRAWVWSYLDGQWERLEERHIYPGQTILVDAGAGGYEKKIGFTGKPSRISVLAEHARGIGATDAADAADEQDELSEGFGQNNRQYKTIATHCMEVAAEATKVVSALGLGDTEAAQVLELAAAAHDIGKSHPAFAGAIRDRNGIDSSIPLAKAPKGRWHRFDRKRETGIYDHSRLGKRPGFRHEMASALALIELAWRARPDHSALQGGRAELLDITVGREIPDEEERIDDAHGLLGQLIGLDAAAFNLTMYAVMCHHGKVRATLPMSPHDQENPAADGTLPIRGVRHGDVLPELALSDTSGFDFELPAVELRLDVAYVGLSPRYGPSWIERVADLRERYSDFQLAWFETLLRVADVRASQIAKPSDPRIPHDFVEVPDIPAEQDRDAKLKVWIERTLAGSVSKPQPGKANETTRRATKSKRRRPSAKKTETDASGGGA